MSKMNTDRVRQLAGLPAKQLRQEAPLLEAVTGGRYETSADFDAEMAKLQFHLKAALDIINAEHWAKHIEDTKQNFEVEHLDSAHDKLYNAIKEAIAQAEDVYDIMEEAS